VGHAVLVGAAHGVSSQRRRDQARALNSLSAPSPSSYAALDDCASTLCNRRCRL
jgi:hypothetical protein